LNFDFSDSLKSCYKRTKSYHLFVEILLAITCSRLKKYCPNGPKQGFPLHNTSLDWKCTPNSGASLVEHGWVELLSNGQGVCMGSEVCADSCDLRTMISYLQIPHITLSYLTSHSIMDYKEKLSISILPVSEFVIHERHASFLKVLWHMDSSPDKSYIIKIHPYVHSNVKLTISTWLKNQRCIQILSR
jgi:hypothetical protein